MADDSERSIKVYLREISGTPLLTMQEEIELAARIKNGDQKARAVKTAKGRSRFRCRNAPKENLA